MTTTLTRRHFLQLAAAAVAGTVAAALGAGRGGELPTAWDQTPTWMNDRPAHELLSSAHPDITLEIHKWRETDLAPDVEDDEITLVDDGLTLRMTRLRWQNWQYRVRG